MRESISTHPEAESAPSREPAIAAVHRPQPPASTRPTPAGKPAEPAVGLSPTSTVAPAGVVQPAASMPGERVAPALRRQPAESAATRPASTTSSPLGINLALLEGVTVRADVVLGQLDTSVGALMRLRAGDVVRTDRLLTQPVDVVVNGNVVARGELVAVDDALGVRLTQVSIDGAA